jgi:hypothetical protein
MKSMIGESENEATENENNLKPLINYNIYKLVADS